MVSTAEEWDERYRQVDRMWSGNPNESLIYAVQALALSPGKAADVGCGEGADALWLSDAGWQVTAFDPSAVAVSRARAADADGAVEWRVWGIEDFPDSPTYDLVTAMYPVLPPTQEACDQLRRLLAPGGVLLFVHHHGSFDCLTPAMVAELSDARVLINETRSRHVTHGTGSHHHDDHIVAVTFPH